MFATKRPFLIVLALGLATAGWRMYRQTREANRIDPQIVASACEDVEAHVRALDFEQEDLRIVIAAVRESCAKGDYSDLPRMMHNEREVAMMVLMESYSRLEMSGHSELAEALIDAAPTVRGDGRRGL